MRRKRARGGKKVEKKGRGRPFFRMASLASQEGYGGPIGAADSLELPSATRHIATPPPKTLKQNRQYPHQGRVRIDGRLLTFYQDLSLHVLCSHEQTESPLTPMTTEHHRLRKERRHSVRMKNLPAPPLLPSLISWKRKNESDREHEEQIPTRKGDLEQQTTDGKPRLILDQAFHISLELGSNYKKNPHTSTRM